ncbi:Cation transport regulator-like protein 2 [Phlyctochytrium planicorne]|nr:Cation transport regulator-like protein 2 [Phlyctochytrium planicorne]
MSSPGPEEYWVFGYGSLIWKVDFPYERKIAGYVKGYIRRFWQGSHDHRGTESSPGRVVTLVPHDEWVKLWKEQDVTEGEGMDAGDDDEVVCWGGYATYTTKVYHPSTTTPIVQSANIYIASTSNHAFLGPKSLESMAAQIATSQGPSGRNIDYFMNLHDALKAVAPTHPDAHIETLEKAIRNLHPGEIEQRKQDLSALVKLREAGAVGLLAADG